MNVQTKFHANPSNSQSYGDIFLKVINENLILALEENLFHYSSQINLLVILNMKLTELIFY